jgi:16S rRNA (adenine1518-N6/adenine1519-N6)-dimethyltransferase
MPQTKRQIEAMLASIEARPNRRLGQNFLIDGNLMRKLVAAAEITPDSVVLEVGAGTGSLTEMLADRAGYVVTVEIDRRLTSILHEMLGNRDNVTLVEMDVLASKHTIEPVVFAAINDARRHHTGPLMLVANLPYVIASPLLMDLLLRDDRPQRYCFTVQKEVADRIVSPPGRKTFGPLSIVIQALCTAQHIADLPASVFWPRPNVASTMLRLDYDPDRAARIRDLPHFVHVVRTAFLHRRKKLTHALEPLTERAPTATAGIDLTKRPEQLTIEEWINLAEQLPRKN